MADTNTTDTLPPFDFNAAFNAEFDKQFSGDDSQSATPAPVTPASDSATTTALKTAATGVVPSGGALAGAKTGALLGEAIGGGPEDPVADLLGLAGGFIGAVAGGVAGAKAQSAVLNKVAPKFQDQIAIDEQAHPVASTIGNIASALPMFELNPGQTVKGVASLWKMAKGVALNEADKKAAMALAVQSGMGVAGGVASPLLSGQKPTLQDIGVNTLTMLILGNPRPWADAAFAKLGLPKPATVQGSDNAGGTPANTGAQPPVAPPLSQTNPVENPSLLRNPPLDPARAAQINDIAQLEVADPTSLQPADWKIIGSLTDNSASDFHPDAQGVYLQAKAAAQQAKSASTATQIAKQELPDLSGITPPISDNNSVSQQLETARQEVDTSPSEAQKESGNYAKGHIKFDGMDVTIENPVGSQRTGTGPGGKPWSVTMPVDYGYIKGTEGKDGDQVDVSIGPNPDGAQKVYVVDQLNPATGKFDEHKSFVGFDSQVQALDAYRKSISDGNADQRIGGVTEMTRDQFKDWALNGDHTKPLINAIGKDMGFTFDGRFNYPGIPPRLSFSFSQVPEGNPLHGVSFEVPSDATNQQITEAAQRKMALVKANTAAKMTVETPAWQKVQGNPEDISNMTAESKAQVKRKTVPEGNAQGTKRAQTYEETTDPNVIYTDVRGGKSKQATNKAAVMQSPDNSHVLVGGIHIGSDGTKLHRYIKSYDKNGKPVTRRFDDMVSEGWKPLATIKSAESTNGYVKTYSPDQWSKIAEDQRAQETARQRTAEAMQEQISKGKEFGLTEQEKESPQHDENQVVNKVGDIADDAPTHFTNDHADTIFDAIHGAKDARDVADAILSDKEATASVKLLMLDSHLIAPGMTKEDGAKVLKNLFDKIYGSYTTAGKDGAVFQERLRAGILDERGQQAAGKAAGLLPTSAEGSKAGGARAAGSAEAGSGREANNTGTAGNTGTSGANGTAASGTESAGAGTKGELKPEDYLYHAADRFNAEIIKKQGIKAGSWFAKTPKEALAFTNNKERAIVFRVPKSDIKPIPADKSDVFGQEFQKAGIFTRSGVAHVGEEINKSRNRDIAEATILRSRPSLEYVAATSRQLIHNLIGLGIDVRSLHESISGMAKDAAKYEEWKNARGELGRAITLSMADVHSPNLETLVGLLHEAGHAVFARETPEMQSMLHEAIQNAVNETLGIEKFVETVSGRYKSEQERARIAQEGRLAEATARALVEKGFKPADASSVIQRVLLAVKTMMQRAVMAVMQAMKLPVSPERALEYFENRMRLALSGSKGDSVVSFLGGPRMRQVEWNNPDAVELIRNRDIRGTSDQLDPAVSKDLTNPTQEKEPGVAAEGIVHRVLHELLKSFNEEGHNPAGITGEDLLKRFGLPEENYPAGEVPMSKINAANEALLRNGFKPVDPNLKINDIRNEPAQKQASAIAIRVLNAVRDYWRSKRRDAEDIVKRSTKQLARLAEPLNKAITNYTDVDMIAGQAALRMQDVITEQKNSANVANELSGKQSMLDQVIRQLDTDIKGNNLLPKPYADALDKLYKRLGLADKDVSFGDMLQRLGEMNLDWQNSKTSELKEQIVHMIDDPMLKPLQENTHDGRALLATAITFAKKNDYLMNLLQLRRSTAMKERMQVNEALKTAISNNVNADKEARALANRLPTLRALANKLLDNIKDLKKQQHELIDERQRQQQFINFHTLADPIIVQTLRPLEARIGALKKDINIGPETDVRIPQTPTSKPESFLQKTLYLTGNNGEVTTQPEVRDALQKMTAWLDANRANREALGVDYNEIETMQAKMSNYLTYFGAGEPIKQLWIAKWLAPTAEKLRLVNTPLTRSVAYMIENANSLYRKYRNEEQVHSREWEVRRKAAMQAIGITNTDNFRQTVSDKFRDYASKNRDIRNVFWDNKEANEASVKAGIENMRNDPATRELFKNNPAAERAVADFFRKDIEVNAWRARNGKAMGNKVYDPRLGLYRDVIGSEAYEFPRGLSDRADEMFTHMGAWAKPMQAKDISEMHASGDADALKAELAPRFNARIWDGFVKWIAYKDGASAFSGPVGKDGTYDYASRDNVIKAYENAKGNPITFAQDLFTLEGGHAKGANISDFVGDTMHSLQAQYHLLETMRGDPAENNNNRALPTPRRHIMDARLTDAAPREFYDYIDADRSNLGNLLRSQAYNAAFGRRMENLYGTIAAAKDEQQKFVQQYDNIAAGFKDLQGRELKKAVLAEAAKQKHNVKALEQAHDNLRTIRKADKEIQGFLAQNQSRPPELNVFATLMHGIGSLTVAGPGTAFIAHTISFEQSLRKFGLNTDGLKMLLDTGRGTAVTALRGFMQTFGRQLAIDADNIEGLERNGLSNPNTLMRWSDQVKSVMISPDYVHNVIGRGAIYAGRAMQLAAQRLSAFHYLARIIQVGNSVAWCKKLQSVIQKGMDHFEDHPEDKSNTEFKFTAKQLGVTEGRAYDYLQFAMGKYGIDLRKMIEDAMDRRAKDDKAPLLTDDIYRRIAQVSLDDMTLESSPTTRAAFLMNNSLGQLANPMLGWALHKTYDVTRSLREANGTRSINGYKTAMLAYTAILPLAMVAAYIRNKFDEDVAGKKQNVSDLSTIHNPQQAFLTAIDNAARVGTFGIAGEAMNMAVNQDNSRPLTLDGRLFFLSTLENTTGAIVNLAHQQNLDYTTVVRPLIQSLGGNGFYQYAGIINHEFGLDNMESRTMNRISVNNFLRVAGRQNNLDVRTYAGMTQTSSQPTPWRASIGNMVMAAYANNAQDFNDARKEAVDRLVEAGNTQQEAQRKVIQYYEDSNPLRTVFRTLPTQEDYRKMMLSMDDNGKVATATALRLYQHYAEQIGATASIFGRGASRIAERSNGTGDATLDSILNRIRPTFNLDAARRNAMMVQ